MSVYSSGPVKVELLYFDGCPTYERLHPRLRGLVERHAAGSEVLLRRVESAGAAERERFLGSPSVRVDGVDVDPEASGRSDFGVKCRLYRADGRYVDAPPDEWIVAALQRTRS